MPRAVVGPAPGRGLPAVRRERVSRRHRPTSQRSALSLGGGIASILRRQHLETHGTRGRSGRLAVDVERDRLTGKGVLDPIVQLVAGHVDVAHRGADVGVAEQPLEARQVPGAG
jgi:hypothetical protein